MAIDYKIIGMRIKTKRRENALTQERFADLLGVTVGYISQVERGITKPNLEMLAKMSEILECDISYFVSNVCATSDSYMIDDISEKIKSLNNQNRRLLVAIIDAMTDISNL